MEKWTFQLEPIKACAFLSLDVDASLAAIVFSLEEKIEGKGEQIETLVPQALESKALNEVVNARKYDNVISFETKQHRRTRRGAKNE